MSHSPQIHWATLLFYTICYHREDPQTRRCIFVPHSTVVFLISLSGNTLTKNVILTGLEQRKKKFIYVTSNEKSLVWNFHEKKLFVTVNFKIYLPLLSKFSEPPPFKKIWNINPHPLPLQREMANYFYAQVGSYDSVKPSHIRFMIHKLYKKTNFT